MALSEAQKKYLRGLGHHLNPVIMIAESGLSPAVASEFEIAISHHELIKVSVRVGDRAARDEIVARLCADATTELVQRIGNTAVLYRENPEKKKKIRLPSR